MRKNLYLILLAVLPMCFAACGSDDDEGGEKGLTASNLIGDWIVVESDDGTGRETGDVGQIWSFNSDGTFYHSKWKNEIYSTWEISGEKLVFQRTQRERKEAYSAEIKDDGRLYLIFDNEYTVLEKYNSSLSIASDYFVGTWEASGGSAYGTWIFNSDGSCNFSHYSAGKNYSTDGKWTYTPSTQTLSTTVTNWEWKITKATTDEWTGGNGQSYKRVK